MGGVVVSNKLSHPLCLITVTKEVQVKQFEDTLVVPDLCSIPYWCLGPDMNARAWNQRTYKKRETKPHFIKLLVRLRAWERYRATGHVRSIAPNHRQIGPKIFI